MIITFDVLASTLTFSGDPKPHGDTVTAALNRHGQTVNLRGLRYGITLTVNGEVAKSQEWPPEGVRYSKTNQNTLTTTRLLWRPEDSVRIEAWVRTPENFYEAVTEFVAPKPPQPYPSWTWANGAWAPPVPRPEDGVWEWDETEQAWAPVEIED